VDAILVVAAADLDRTASAAVVGHGVWALGVCGTIRVRAEPALEAIATAELEGLVAR
jgi:hypothetical protein